MWHMTDDGILRRGWDSGHECHVGWECYGGGLVGQRQIDFDSAVLSGA